MEIPNKLKSELKLVRANTEQQQHSGLASSVWRKMHLFHLDYIFHLKNKSMNAR